MIGLTAKQNNCLDAISAHVAKHGHAPSHEEIATSLELGSKSEVHRLVMALEERGALRRIPGRARALELMTPQPPTERELTRLRTPELLTLLAHVCGILAFRIGVAKIRETLDRIKRFSEATGIDLGANCGIDCDHAKGDWNGVAPTVEIVTADFAVARAARAPSQRSLFEAAT